MKSLITRSIVLGLAGAVGLLALGSGCVTTSTQVKTEDDHIADLASPNEEVVVRAMVSLEKEYPTSTRGISEIKKYLGDERPKVRRKAARVAGVLHADVTAAELDAICALLKSTDPYEVIDGLKAWRGLKAELVVPRITPLLQHEHPNVVRDACRTLAVLADQSVIPLIEPLRQSNDKAIQRDANDAIFALEKK